MTKDNFVPTVELMRNIDKDISIFKNILHVTIIIVLQTESSVSRF